MINSMTGYCAFFETEDEAIDHCREVNRVIKAFGPKALGAVFGEGVGECLCAVIDGPGDVMGVDYANGANYAVVDLESAKEILDWPESGLPCLVVTD